MKRLELSVWNTAFWLIILCQATVLPATLGLGMLSRVANAATLALFTFAMLLTLTRRHAERVTVFYLMPAFLVAVGYVINIARSGDLEAFGHLGLVVPWIAVLSVPFVRGFDWTRYWHYFHRFMFWASLVALAEYVAIYTQLLTPTRIVTDLGVFQKGILTIVYSLKDEDVYFRLYGVFPEPGTYAMFLLPVIAYALVMRKPLALVIYLVCLVLTGSLGGYIGLVLLAVPFVIWLMRGQHVARGLVVLGVGLAIVGVLGGTILDYLTTAYTGRGASATVRESNVQLFAQNMLPMLAAEPFGFDLKGKAYSQLEGQAYYFGSNFTLAAAAVTGGVLSFIGYLTFVLTNMGVWLTAFLARRATEVEACALLCLPAMVSFVVQRATIFESALYAYLFAPLVIEVLRARWMASDAGFLRSLRSMSVPQK